MLMNLSPIKRAKAPPGDDVDHPAYKHDRHTEELSSHAGKLIAFRVGDSAGDPCDGCIPGRSDGCLSRRSSASSG